MLRKSRVSNRSRCSRHMFRSRPGVRWLFNRHVSRPALSLTTLHHCHVIQKKSQSTCLEQPNVSFHPLIITVCSPGLCSCIARVCYYNYYDYDYESLSVKAQIKTDTCPRFVCRLREISEMKSSCCCQWKCIIVTQYLVAGFEFITGSVSFFVQFTAISHPIKKSAI